MRAIRQPRERRRIDLVALLFQDRGHVLPAPAAMIGAMNEDERLARTGLRHRFAAAKRRGARAKCGARDCGTACHRTVVGHVFSPISSLRLSAIECCATIAAIGPGLAHFRARSVARSWATAR